MNNNIRVGSLFGIPFYINPSWFLVLGLVTLTYGYELTKFPQLGGLLPWLLGLVTALLLFASVLAHELGHSLVAIRQGINVNSITLFLFGGLASLEKEAKDPASAFWIAIAGPAVSVALFFLLLGINLTLPLPAPLAAIVTLLSTLNLIVAGFNLIPGLPLDGGNILKAAIWKLTGNPYRGVIVASRAGQVFGWLAVAIGFLSVFGLSRFGSPWTILIGFFLLQNAGFSAQSASLQERLSHYTAQDAVLPDSPMVAIDLSLREFVNNYVIGKEQQWRKFLVTDREGKLAGVLLVEDLKAIPTSEWPQTEVGALVKPYQQKAIPAERSLLEVVMMLEKQENTSVPVVREDGVLVGLLEKQAIASLLEPAEGNSEKQTNPA